MPGKYTHLKGQLTKISGEPEYQARVEERKEKLRQIITEAGDTFSMANVGYALLIARNEKDRLEELVKDENLSIEACNQLLVEMMEAQDFTNLKLTNGASLSIKDDVYCTVTDKPAYYRWIRETGQEDMLTVNYMTMSSAVKNNLIDGTPIPPGIDVFFKQSIMVRGGKDIA